MDVRSVLFITVLFGYVHSYNILVVWHHFVKSHFLVYEPFFKNLARKGHHVTMISYFPQKEPIPNYRDVSLLDENNSTTGLGLLRIDQIKYTKWEQYGFAHVIAEMSQRSCKTLLTHPNVLSFLKEKGTFDVIMREVVDTNCDNAVIKKFKAPVIGLSTCLNVPHLNPMYGIPDNPAYIPNPFLDFSSKMNFFQRLENTLLVLFHKWVYHHEMRLPGNEFAKKYLGEDILSEMDLDYNSSLLLMNTHFSLSQSKPFPPNAVEVGGIHIAEQKPLPKNLEKYLNDSPDGVIYMSMGSLLEGSSFPPEKRAPFLKVFSKLKQRIIWKWESETMEGLPKNVMLYKWVPQKDFICHPKVVAFISHGGWAGTVEAAHCGVPMIIIPQFGDQFSNGALVEAHGFGVKMLLPDATEENIANNLKLILSEKYRKQAKEISKRFRDRPQSPMDLATYSVEYVARHRGASFLRPASVDMPFYQYYLLDVIAFILFSVLTFLAVIYYLMKLSLCKMVHKFGNAKKVKSA